ncbi:hypothetical protein IWW36_003778 [Coemansia brasiliensis]|uniref:Uncharacterized protein n=1 Tax=Coemansia brasiliensis TaxID=2650707 RepID=A0A9W8I5U3_9FUNG|nr:hypothetical protein IWW36_003778 [Coemansia brasiliensis]
MLFKNLKAAVKRIATRACAKIHCFGRKERADFEMVQKVEQLQAELDFVRKQCDAAARIRTENEQAAQDAETKLAVTSHTVAGLAEIKADLEQAELQISKEHRAQAELRKKIAKALARKEELGARLWTSEEREGCYRASLLKNANAYEVYTSYIVEAESNLIKAN